MRALTPKRILTNPFFSVEYFTLLCCVNHATIVLWELNPFEQHIMDEKADIKRFNNIFVTHRDRYIRFAYSYTYNQETAEDLVTESLMYYWENRHRLEEVKDIPLYILVLSLIHISEPTRH